MKNRRQKATAGVPGTQRIERNDQSRLPVIRRREFLFTGLAPFLKLGRVSRACIVLRLTGGPSQLDTWDMKPDAPGGIRGPFRAIRTNVPGVEISEIFPRMARLADRYAIVRSVHHEVNTHQAAWDAMLPAELAGRLVVVNMFDEIAWDVHGWKPFGSMECYRDVVGPMFDAAYSSLLEDLGRRGLLENTLVVAMGEFGRTPKINPDGGRDHWPHCFSILMAGGGIRGGQVYGSSDRIGAEPRDKPVTPLMIAATIRKALGNEPADDGAQPLTELFS
jgi:hypothetical protein